MASLDFEVIWKIWLALFVFFEGYAVYLGEGRTFSHQVWAWFNVADGWSIERVILMLFLGWLLGHLAWEQWS